MSARFYADVALAAGTRVRLPERAARHAQVLRLQPGERITLFNGQAGPTGGEEGEFDATVERMGRGEVDVAVGGWRATAREAARAVHLVVGMPANDRMDWLVEKATELGAASIQPVMSERGVLRLNAERADKKVAHWRGIAIAACEQCGRNRLPRVHDVRTLDDWLKGMAGQADHAKSSAAESGRSKLLLSLGQGSRPLSEAVAWTGELVLLSGPEGGLSAAEEAAAIACGFDPVSLGPRVLRAETAPLACLSRLA